MQFKSFIRHGRDILILPCTVTVLVPYLIFKATPDVIPDFLSIKLFAGLLFGIGLILFSWTNYLFQKLANGTLAPWTDKEKLIIKGPYQYCRNPMITAVLLVLISESLWFRSMPIMVWASAFFVLTTFVFIAIEEPFLENKFGDEYRAYKSKVPRWIPHISKSL